MVRPLVVFVSGNGPRFGATPATTLLEFEPRTPALTCGADWLTLLELVGPPQATDVSITRGSPPPPWTSTTLWST
jgi:hypothetical protein